MCDCLCALASPAQPHTLFAKNSDRPPTEAQQVEGFAPRREPRTRTTYITVDGAPGGTLGFVGSRPTWMWGVEHGVNEAGVAAGNATIYTTLDPRPFPPALTGMDLVRLVLERAATAADAVAVLAASVERYGQGGSGHAGEHRPYWSSFLVADPAAAFVVETSGRELAVETVGRARATSNRTTIAGFDEAHRHPRQPVETRVDPRLAASRAVLAEDPVTLARLKAHLRSHDGDDGWSVCMHVAGRQPEATTASLVAELPTGSRRPRAHMLMGSPCASVYVPLVVGQPFAPPPRWASFAALDARDRSALDALEAELAADIRDDPTWNDEAWQRVSAALDAERV